MHSAWCLRAKHESSLLFSDIKEKKSPRTEWKKPPTTFFVPVPHTWLYRSSFTFIHRQPVIQPANRVDDDEDDNNYYLLGFSVSLTSRSRLNPQHSRIWYAQAVHTTINRWTPVQSQRRKNYEENADEDCLASWNWSKRILPSRTKCCQRLHFVQSPLPLPGRSLSCSCMTLPVSILSHYQPIAIVIIFCLSQE